MRIALTIDISLKKQKNVLKNAMEIINISLIINALKYALLGLILMRQEKNAHVLIIGINHQKINIFAYLKMNHVMMIILI